MSLDDKLDQVLARHDELSGRLATETGMDPRTMGELSRELSELEPVVEQIHRLRRARREMADAEAMMADPEADSEMRALADEEYRALKEQLPALEEEIRLALLPKDANDEKNAILEVRAGTGGEEAALFARDLFRMYEKYAELKGWRLEVLSMEETDMGGAKEVVARVSGQGVFAKLKFESGVHRVQRVPDTESGGRIHTSAATVAVLPEMEDVEVHVEEKDIRVDTFRAQGAGGQHVNTTDSAVRITHFPSGVVVSCQEEKSQHKNRAKAFTILRSRLYEQQRREQEQARDDNRRLQVGSGDRSERVRTYNFPQDRVTDHRINLTLYKLEKVLAGEALDDVVDALIAEDQAEKLAEMVAGA